MPALELKNFTITKLKNQFQKDYYLIKDNETDKAYFCFQKSLKEGWEELENNFQNLKNLEIEYLESEKGNRVIKLWGDNPEFYKDFDF